MNSRAVQYGRLHPWIRRGHCSVGDDAVKARLQPRRQLRDSRGLDETVMAARKMVDEGQLAGPTGPAQAVDLRAVQGRSGNVESTGCGYGWAVAPVRPAVCFPWSVNSRDGGPSFS